MGIFSGLFGAAASAIVGTPDMPGFVQIDPAQEQKKAISGNLESMPKLEELGSKVNTFNQQQIEHMLSSSIPMYDRMKGEISGNIDSMLRGEIPTDVSETVLRSDAARSLGLGVGGSGTGMGRNLVARDLGLTSLDLTTKGISSAEDWMKTMASIEQPGMFNVSSMFLTPQQTMAQDTEERNAKFQHDWSKNLMDWQLSPMQGLGEAVRGVGELVDTGVGAAAGGMGGGM